MFWRYYRSFVMSIVRGRNFEISNSSCYSSCNSSDTISFKKKQRKKERKLQCIEQEQEIIQRTHIWIDRQHVALSYFEMVLLRYGKIFDRFLFNFFKSFIFFNSVFNIYKYILSKFNKFIHIIWILMPTSEIQVDPKSGHQQE